MRYLQTGKLVLLQISVNFLVAVEGAGCGGYNACTGTELCATKTFTSPISTVITTCVPSPTCLGVYQSCEFGGSGPWCCSGYCAATKCRSTDNKWPSCSEDLGPCLEDENCCYGNQCINGLCVKPSQTMTSTSQPSVCPTSD